MPSARANLPLLFTGQAAKETTVNTALTILEALSVGSVKSRTIAAPPLTPIEGDTYVVPATGTTGVFVGQENKIAHWYNAAWKFYTPQNGWNVRVISESYLAIAFNGSNWVVTAGSGSNSMPPATNTAYGAVKTDVLDADPVVYLKKTTDTLLSGKEPTITTLPVTKGGIGVTTPPANFQILLGNSAGTGYELVTLTAGTNVSIVKSGTVLNVSSTASGSGGGGRELVTSARTYFVRKDGNDANTGLTNVSTGAFLTIQRALDLVANLDLNHFTVTIRVDTGVYSSPLFFKTLTGSGQVILEGNMSTPSNVEIRVSGVTSTPFAALITISGVGSSYTVQGFRLSSSVSNFNGFYHPNESSTLSYRNLEFGAGINAHFFGRGGAFVCTGSYSILAGAASCHWGLERGSRLMVEEQNTVITVLNTPNFPLAFLYMDGLSQGYINSNAGSVSFSGAATGKRFQLTNLCYVSGNSQNFLPGSIAGTSAGNSIYV